MTREGSKILLARDALMMGEASGRTILDGDATLHIIDQIYDDFESRTCESCKYSKTHKGKTIEDGVECSNQYMYRKFLLKDFGCNLYERKE
jgi:hypothetical protein